MPSNVTWSLRAQRSLCHQATAVAKTREAQGRACTQSEWGEQPRRLAEVQRGAMACMRRGQGGCNGVAPRRRDSCFHRSYTSQVLKAVLRRSSKYLPSKAAFGISAWPEAGRRRDMISVHWDVYAGKNCSKYNWTTSSPPVALLTFTVLLFPFRNLCGASSLSP